MRSVVIQRDRCLRVRARLLWGFPARFLLTREYEFFPIKKPRTSLEDTVHPSLSRADHNCGSFLADEIGPERFLVR
jgi:hypothetical protein